MTMPETSYCACCIAAEQADVDTAHVTRARLAVLATFVTLDCVSRFGMVSLVEAMCLAHRNEFLSVWERRSEARGAMAKGEN